jgi:alkaline phosphatase D
MPNFPWAPFQSRRIKGFDLLARYLWPKQGKIIPPPAMETSSSSEVFESSPSGLSSSVPTATVASVPSMAANTPPAEFLLFLGDFVYADVPFFFGDDKEAYRRLYRRNYQSTSFRKIYERLRECFFHKHVGLKITTFNSAVFHIYDDHEVSTPSL